jgi:hypothetical protein
MIVKRKLIVVVMVLFLGYVIVLRVGMLSIIVLGIIVENDIYVKIGGVERKKCK